MHARHRRRLAERKADLVWTALGFVALTLGFLAWAEWRAPGMYDLEYGVRLETLQQRLAEDPERPLVLVVGSSRTGQAFLPEIMPPLKNAQGEEILAFNFSHLMAGPVMNLMEWRRLQRNGVKPQWLVLELVPTLMMDEHHSTPATIATAADFPVLLDYFPNTRVWKTYAKVRLNPWGQHRQTLLRRFAPALANQVAQSDNVKLGSRGGDDGWNLPTNISPEDRQRITAKVAAGASFLKDWRMHPNADKALRTVLADCRREGIAALLLITPESSELRACYSIESYARFAEYCDRLGLDYQTPLVNAREWLEDDDFTDGHHVLRRGAERFTRRFAQEVLQPFLRNELRPPTLAIGSR